MEDNLWLPNKTNLNFLGNFNNWEYLQYLWGGGPNMKYPESGEEINADLGRSFLFLYSKAWDLVIISIESPID